MEADVSDAVPGKVLVTGAGGFIGHALCQHLAVSRMPFVGVVRSLASDTAWSRDTGELVALGDLAAADWSDVLRGVDAIVHLAGRAHVMSKAEAADPTPYVIANVHVTRRLCDAAVRAGVRRIVLASSVKVYGDASVAGRPFGPGDAAAPADAYAYSKMEAEAAVVEACKTGALEGVVLRLPLTYGAGVKGNFVALLDAVAEERRLPLAGIANKRSLLYVGNAVSAFVAALTAPAIVGQTLPVADAHSVSTSELVERIAAALDVPTHMYRAPASLLRAAAALAGRRGAVARLLGSLEVDATIFGGRTGWLQPYSIEQGLTATARWWRLRHAL
jgi:UDP-N-acetyl-alpha-D-quinovosamine dehydrogenase